MASEKSEHTLEITADTFDEVVLGADGPVLVDFWAAWCPPCRALAPTIHAVADEYAGRATVGTVDVDHEQSLAERLEIRSIPTVILFEGGRELNRFVGLTARETLSGAIEAAAA
jgi:thioredoxin 1